MGWLIGVGGVLALFTILLFMPAKVSGSFSYIGGEVSYTLYAGIGPVRINLKKLLEKEKSKPVSEEIKGEKEKKKLSFADVEKGLKKGVEALRYLRKKFTVSLFSFKAKFSLGDAADTGIATGAAYGSIYSILGAIDRYFVLKKHEVIITPVFGGIGFETEFEGKFQLRLIYCLGLINKIRKGDIK
ncbi:MAG: DUF2953 domain-containing protein [Clostridia bacterium]|nr:DUF2953 domain-containing protein [Clostridia bacterium]